MATYDALNTALRKSYITRLREQVTTLEADDKALRERAQEFRVHLAGPKFSGTEHDGSRKDWIATADAERWLEYVLNGADDDPVIGRFDRKTTRHRQRRPPMKLSFTKGHR